jgi:hypothetical protein
MEHSPFWAAAALAEFVRDQASWRRTQAQRFPDDARNAQSADALEQLAMHVEALPDSNRHLIELVELNAFDDASHFTGGEEARRAIARWGFDDTTSHMRPRDLLQDLVAITRRARRKPARERDKTMTETIATVPDARPALWVNASVGGRVKWHAVKAELAGDRALTHCDKKLELTGETQELRAGVVPISACSVCETALASAPSAGPFPAIPDLPMVLWFKAQHGQPVKHAAKDRLNGNIVRTYCGDTFDFPATASGLRFPALDAGSCAICELELQRAELRRADPQPASAGEIGKHQLSDTERDVMYDLFTLAHATDPDCQARERALRDAIASDPTNYADELLAYVMALTRLHAAIAPAGLSRVPILAPIDRSDGARLELLDRGREKDLERFLRPLFREAGIDDPFILQRRGASGVKQTSQAVDEAETRMKRFFSEPRDAELKEAALEAILRIPTPAGTHVDWDATKQIIRRTVLAAAHSRGSTLEQQGESHSVFVLLREELQRIANEN